MNKSTNIAFLVARLKNSDISAFTEIYQIYSIKIFNFLYRHLRSQEEAEELLQDVFLKVWDNRDQINTDLNFEGYIFKVSKNKMLNHLRKRHPVVSLEENSISFINGCNTTERDVYLHELEEIFDNAINQLPPKRQEIYNLCHIKGFTYQEAAETLNISPKTVESQMGKAIKSIKSYFSLRYNNLISFTIFLFF